MFDKLLIANRGDNARSSRVAAKAHAGLARVSRSHIALRAQRAAIEPPRHV